MSRQVVKSEFCSVLFQELDFEIPAESQKGVLTTVEGMITCAIEGLAQLQPERMLQNKDVYDKIEQVINKLNEYLNGTPFTIIIDDPSGNSYIENFNAPHVDPSCLYTSYKRTNEHCEFLGIPFEEENVEEEFDLENQVHVFHGKCSRCNQQSETRMHMIEIPHFKQVIIMATDCDSCGYKNNEVKSGGPVSEKGLKITLVLQDAEDLSRDILKSESCRLSIPEIGLELSTGTLGGRFTTIEGLLSQVYEELEGRSQFLSGDSSTAESKQNFEAFLYKLQSVLKGELFPVTLILDDPLANSHLQNIYAPESDPNMAFEKYDRSFEQNEDFGLNDLEV